MAKYEFDRLVSRYGTDSLKYDFAAERGHSSAELPLWVADMDFQAPPEVLERMEQRVRHGIFGYTETGEAYFAAAAGWFRRRCGWSPEREWLVKTPGVVFALAAAVRAFTEPGDKVLIQPPVYYPFFEVIRDNGRIVEENTLVYDGEKYHMDFAALEKQLKGVKLMLLCSPHNPVGRVWTAGELQTVADLCAENGTILVSDEIHCDFIREGYVFCPAARFLDTAGLNAVICTSPGKTFNLAGLQVSNIFIPDEELRNRFRHEIAAAGYSQLNSMGLLAAQAAYEKGEPWFDALTEYLAGSLELVRRILREEIPSVRLVEPEGTYLVWLDFRDTGLAGAELDRFIREKAGLWLDDGRLFGGGTDTFQRMNIATGRSVLAEALGRLGAALREHH